MGKPILSPDPPRDPQTESQLLTGSQNPFLVGHGMLEADWSPVPATTQAFPVPQNVPAGDKSLESFPGYGCHFLTLKN